MFETLPLSINFIIFAVLAGLIWGAGTHLSWLIDAVAEKTKIARAFLGLVLLATATELPEIVTTISATSSGNGALALNNMFGGIPMQVAVLAVADAVAAGGVLTAFPRKPTVVMAGLFLIAMLSMLLGVHITGDTAIGLPVGIDSVAVALAYLLAMYHLKQYQSREVWSPVDLPGDEQDAVKDEAPAHYRDKSLKQLIALSALASLVILVCGVAVVRVAEHMAVQTGLGSSFIGATLLAITTSLPELSTAIAAVRVRAYSMALSNIFGSNLIMVFLVLPADMFFTKGPLLNEIDASAAFALLVGIVLTAIYCIGMLIRPKTRIMGMGPDSLLVLAVYFASLVMLYQLR